jgi:hypothetical protein
VVSVATGLVVPGRSALRQKERSDFSVGRNLLGRARSSTFSTGSVCPLASWRGRSGSGTSSGSSLPIQGLFVLKDHQDNKHWAQSRRPFFLVGLEHISGPFCSGYVFGVWRGLGGVRLRTIFPGWPRTLIFLISAFQVARISGVSYRRRLVGFLLAHEL